jgi:hypothetical protein
MYCHHKPQDCKELEREKVKKDSSADDHNGLQPKTSVSAPKLKLNNNLATALAALDGALKKSTTLDTADSSDQDFQ